VAKENAVHTEHGYVTFCAEIMREARHNRGQRRALEGAYK